MRSFFGSPTTNVSMSSPVNDDSLSVLLMRQQLYEYKQRIQKSVEIESELRAEIGRLQQVNLSLSAMMQDMCNMYPALQRASQ